MPQYAPVIDLATLNGTNGFRLDGIDADDQSGYSVASAGDVNGDGLADILIGAREAACGIRRTVSFGRGADGYIANRSLGLHSGGPCRGGRLRPDHCRGPAWLS